MTRIRIKSSWVGKFAFALFLHGALVFAQPNTTSNCPSGSTGVPTYWYTQAVWQRLTPPDNKSSLITITISVEPELKIVLRARDNNRFELLEGTPSQPFYEVLERAGKSCRLPTNPAEAVGLLKITWTTTPLGPAEFAQLHREFIDSGSRYIGDAQKHYEDILQNGGRVVLHAQEYELEYDNGGYEHVKFAVEETSGGEPSLLNWAKRVLALSKTPKPDKR